MKILTIVIPTWNRDIFLEKNISYLSDMIKNKNIESIDILIIDNASTDNTSRIARDYEEKNNFIKYIRNDENIGSINNFIKGINLVNTKYVHLLGDDDRIDHKYFDYFPKLLIDKDFSVIHLNSYGFDVDPDFEKPLSLTSKIIQYKNYDDFIIKCNQDLTFISAFVLNAELSKKTNKFDFYSEVNFSQIVMASALEGNNFCILDYLIAAKRNNASTEIFQNLFLRDFVNIINSLESNFLSANSIKKFKKKYFLGYLPYYIFREINHRPEKKGELLRNINEIARMYPILKCVLSGIVNINKKYRFVYSYILIIIGRIYADGIVEVLMKSIVIVKSKFIYRKS